MNEWWWALFTSEWPYSIHSSHESIVDSIQVNKAFPKVLYIVIFRPQKFIYLYIFFF